MPLVVAAFPFVARLVEGSLREVDGNIIEAAQSMGATPFQIVWKVMLPERVRHSFDINVLLGNLLENAIEAAGKTERKYLSVHVKLKRGILKVKIENSFESSHILDEEQHGKDMVLKTTKPFTEQHGIGLKNVKKILEKYNGTMAVTAQEGIFCVNLLLYMARMENGL